MSSNTYERRKIAHICAWCLNALSNQEGVVCDRCKEKESPGYLLRKQARLARRAAKLEQGPSEFACCGVWQPITQLPHRCMKCQRAYLASFP